MRGSDSTYNLVTLNGIPINSFNYGGLVDFSQIASDFISEIDVTRGPQSAVQRRSYALGSQVDLITRSPDNGPSLDFLAEGGTWAERRFAGSGSFLYKGWGVSASASALNDNGPVQNSDYRNDSGFLSLQRRWRSQSLFAFGDFDSNNVGEPGPYGSDPNHDYSGIDTISRSKNNTSTYGIHYQDDITSTFRQDVTAGFSLNNSFYLSPFGDSFNKDIRLYGDARETWRHLSVLDLRGWIYVRARGSPRNSLLRHRCGLQPLSAAPRHREGICLENRLVFFKRFFLNIGAA